jgi:biofilm PGA synthesis N-glycosyltransferase PgaC
VDILYPEMAFFPAPEILLNIVNGQYVEIKPVNTLSWSMMNAFIYSLMVLVAYPYAIYPCLSFLISRFKKEKKYPPYYPSVTVVIAAYNEINSIREKLENTWALNYPSALLQVVVVTDGSTDGTAELVAADKSVLQLHHPDRKGKAAAINSAIDKIESAIVVCTDANTMLNRDALVELVKYFQDPFIGAVAGEKRVVTKGDHGSVITEGFYWQYESKLRQWDSTAFSVTGAVGELYAIRREYLQPVPLDTICEDLLITTRVIEKGKRVVYEPGAYGTEQVSETIEDEWKRKVRIAAGSIQFFQRMNLLQFCSRHTYAAFQLVSRKLFRWLVVPYVLPVLLVAGCFQALETDSFWIGLLCITQFVFYGWAIAGWIFRKLSMPALFFFPFYFLMANVAIIAGTIQYWKGKSFVLWDRVNR